MKGGHMQRGIFFYDVVFIPSRSLVWIFSGKLILNVLKTYTGQLNDKVMVLFPLY